MAGSLLLDENLSPRLTSALSGPYPGSMHVRDVQLKGQSDRQIWDFAAGNGYTIVTKDDDFRGMSLFAHAPAIEAFISEPITSLLTLRKP
ncbi:DUF5615 family PIN-like protein [Cyanobium sp. HWJ4-Hawea]|uniref:DUF5615 family PIN-like protein n=1 Tax=Cyanobium sp. HWJ4-Hawea TaxID=2823713 RepID=UPI0020CE820B|nr:DUF5615 family PIN-like protein [Cyanobium sp. HWJ4-Hawea]MCP9808360.1 DUF5615 family PIN-like protein [Cyanobium sp. HWJ4-Hawea]